MYEGGSGFAPSSDHSREVKIFKCYMKRSHLKKLANLESIYLKYGGPSTTSVGQMDLQVNGLGECYWGDGGALKCIYGDDCTT